jgi:hypothetical protein
LGKEAGTPFEQAPDLQSSGSGGRSASSMMDTMPPAPSQTFVAQSPTVWLLTGIPYPVYAIPHIPSMQVRV